MRRGCFKKRQCTSASVNPLNLRWSVRMICCLISFVLIHERPWYETRQGALACWWAIELDWGLRSDGGVKWRLLFRFQIQWYNETQELGALWAFQGTAHNKQINNRKNISAKTNDINIIFYCPAIDFVTAWVTSEHTTINWEQEMDWKQLPIDFIS